jgi:mRNA (guanine-N7-)-methyltransferase
VSAPLLAHRFPLTSRSKLAAVPEESDDLRFGNSCYHVKFDEREHIGMYGHAYHFYLQDAVDDVPEYIVHWDNFVEYAPSVASTRMTELTIGRLAHEYGLRLIYKKAFHEVLAEEQDSRDFGVLLKKMGVVNEEGASAMDGDQWEAASKSCCFGLASSGRKLNLLDIYMAFAFEKM